VFYVHCPYCGAQVGLEDPPPNAEAYEEWEDACPRCGGTFAVWWEPCYETRPLVRPATHIPSGTSQYHDNHGCAR